MTATIENLIDRQAKLDQQRAVRPSHSVWVPASAGAGKTTVLFARVLECHGGMKIQTIHAFCQSLLRRFPLEAGIAPHFEPLDERSAAEQMLAAREVVLERARSGARPDLAAALVAVTARIGER